FVLLPGALRRRYELPAEGRWVRAVPDHVPVLTGADARVLEEPPGGDDRVAADQTGQLQRGHVREGPGGVPSDEMLVADRLPRGARARGEARSQERVEPDHRTGDQRSRRVADRSQIQRTGQLHAAYHGTKGTGPETRGKNRRLHERVVLAGL